MTREAVPSVVGQTPIWVVQLDRSISLNSHFYTVIAVIKHTVLASTCKGKGISYFLSCASFFKSNPFSIPCLKGKSPQRKQDIGQEHIFDN